jgi:hypothetical protein
MKDAMRFVYANIEEERKNPETGDVFYVGRWTKVKECQSFYHAIKEAERLQAESVMAGNCVSHCVNS